MKTITLFPESFEIKRVMKTIDNLPRPYRYHIQEICVARLGGLEFEEMPRAAWLMCSNLEEVTRSISNSILGRTE